MAISRDYRPIWERREDETSLQYERFRAYLTMRKRNITELARQLNIADSHMREIAASNAWRERAAAYDRWVTAELDRAAVGGAMLEIANTTTNNKTDGDPILADYEAMRAEMWEVRTELLKKVKAMLSFEVGNSTKLARKAFRVKNPETKRFELNIVAETKTDPRWTWGDVAKITEMVDKLGQEILSMPPDVVRLLPEFCYQLRRSGFDVATFMQQTIDKLKAS